MTISKINQVFIKIISEFTSKFVQLLYTQIFVPIFLVYCYIIKVKHSLEF
ncbi:hypothetical protein BSIG_5617 [Bacteroides thetaiotaomicron]|nr:hypothetical protein BSIG_5617 [Bacteroides thetaiotaomicron]